MRQGPGKCRLGVSACLLGERVRYDGALRPSPWVLGEGSQLFDFVRICPEVELALGVPRERIEVHRSAFGLGLRGVQSGTELGPAMLRWAALKLDELAPLGLCGFVLRARSPSCGLKEVPIRLASGELERGDGLFAAALRQRWPGMPLCLDEALCNPEYAAEFVTAVGLYARQLACPTRFAAQ